MPRIGPGRSRRPDLWGKGMAIDRVGMRALCALLLGGMMGAAMAAAADTPAADPAPQERWRFHSTPAWQDEFDGEGVPDPARWSYDTGGHGWGNNELQYYTDRPANAFVSDGLLTIVAHRQRAG